MCGISGASPFRGDLEAALKLEKRMVDVSGIIIIIPHIYVQSLV